MSAERSISELCNSHDALGLGALVRAGEVSPSELVEEAIRRIEALNPRLNAVCYKAYDYGRAAAADPALPDGPFKGVPFLQKELATLWEGIPTTNACAYFKDFVAPNDMEVIRRIKRAGFVLVGKSNAPEYGWALATEPKMYGRTYNPWNETVVAGGSSGGAAVAVAARMVPLADASDGAGSIRVPAAHNGLVGLKPARGRITLAPNYADFWFGGATFLCVTRSVRDTAAYLDAVGGSMPGDPYYAPQPPRPFLDEVGANPGKLRIAYTTASPDGKPIHAEVAQAVSDAARLCESLGHEVEERDLELEFAPLWKAYTDITAVQTAMAFEASAPFVGHAVREDEIAPTLWAIKQKGQGISGVQHTLDIEVLRQITRSLVASMTAFDVHLMPVMGQPPPPHGHYDMTIADADTYNNEVMGPDCVFTAPFNAAGLPAMSLPLHWTADGLPIGVQLVGREYDEATLFRLAGQLEGAQPWAERLPPVCA